jgi:isopropylmalate/homocitrate/citramalate synthase
MPNASVQPSVVGGSFRVVWGHHHSRSVIRAKLEQLKLAASEDSVREIQAKIQLGLAQLKTYPQWLTEAEVDEICRGVARRSG